MQKRLEGFFPSVLGVRITSVTKESVRAELDVRPELCTVPGRLHGGAIMAFADTLGAMGTTLHLPAGAGTTTIESKTNFFGAAKEGTTITGESTPLHLGRRTMVWQTNIRSPEGKLLAQVTQTQFVLLPE
ncbi:MAG: PaaI family thioesterase [Dehalococcoidia bacterium]|nr:PaaI family thioesterase [Dehalococcoidia bacterium]